MDWHALKNLLSDRLRLPLADLQATPLSGGDINQAFRLDDGAHRFFVKINRAELLPMFEAEQVGLDEIRRSQSIRVPKVIATGSDDISAYIVLEYIDLSARPTADLFAQQLATMHRFQHQQFGFYCDNTIGSTPQTNSFSDDWIDFWQRQRLGFQLQLLASRGNECALVEVGEKLNEKIGGFFRNYQPQPSLLHGDLWSGNQAADANGNPVIYDPACYYGDHQADLAMMELFGHPGERFFAVYNEIMPIDADYPLRRDLYNLYHILNHANLFAGGYLAQAKTMTEKLLARL